MELFNLLVGVGAIAIFISTILLWVIFKKNEFFRTNIFLFLAIVTFCATAGSLMYSEFFGFIPCPLCWYQRILMFPLPIIFFLAYVYKIRDMWRIGLTFSIIGIIISFYQIILQVFDVSSIFCEPGSAESCAISYVDVFGFMSIPVMSSIIFLFVFVASFILYKQKTL